MPSQKYLQALSVLELRINELYNLTEAEKISVITKKYRKLALSYHPDHHNDPASIGMFISISEAYQLLTEDRSNLFNDNYVPEINTYFTLEHVHIPDTAFDYYLRDGIERAYEALMERFSKLNGADEKRAFAQRYKPFLDLKAALDLKLTDLSRMQAEYIYQRHMETLTQLMTRSYRELLLRTYGEEFLNDFKYRHALATGILYPLLATRKLISPIKALSFVLNGLLILPYFLYQHASKSLANSMVNDINRKNIGLFIFKLLAVTSLAILTLYGICHLPIPLFATLLSLPLLSRTLSVIASPVNELFRPWATYLSTSPAMFTAISLIGLATLGYLLLSVNAFASVMAILPYLTLTLLVFNCIGIVKFLYEACSINRNLGIILSVIMVASLVAGLFIPIPEMSTPVANTVMFFLELTNISSIYLAIQTLQYLKETEADLSASLPLPQEHIPESLKEATLLGYSNASTQSHRFFNTPKDAECLPLKGRSTWQQTCSFFGIDTLKPKEEPPRYTQQLTTLALLDAGQF